MVDDHLDGILAYCDKKVSLGYVERTNLTAKNVIRRAIGVAGCGCKDPKYPGRHGPHYQLSYVHRGKSTTRFVRKNKVKTVKAQLANYKRFRKLMEDWIRLALESAEIKTAQASP